MITFKVYDELDKLLTLKVRNLAQLTKTVLANGLSIFGVSAPERM